MIRIRKTVPLSRKVGQYRKALVKTLYRLDDCTILLQELETENKCLKERVQYMEKKIDEYVEVECKNGYLNRRIEYLAEKLEDYEDAFNELIKDFEAQRIELRDAKEDRHHFMSLCENMVGVKRANLEETLQVVVTRNMDELRTIIANDCKYIK